MKIVKHILFILLFQAITTHAQKVSNVSFRQEQSNIIVSYDLETKTTCKISLFVSIDDGKTWQGPLKKVTGDVGAKIASGNHSIIWNVLEEFEELSGDKIKFQVRADETKSQTITSINQALIKNPKDAKLFKLRGDLKQESGDRKGAIADYTKAILLNPKYADAYKARGILNLGDSEAAISDFNKAIVLNPNDVSIFDKRGSRKFGLRDYKGAISDYTNAMQLEPKQTYWIIQRARAKRELEDYIGAINDMNKVIELDSTKFTGPDYLKDYDYKDKYYLRGINKSYLNDVEGANLDFEKSGNPKFVYERIAAIKFYYKDYNSAIYYCTKSIDALPVSIVDSIGRGDSGFIGRAFSKYMQNDEIGAKVDFNNYIEKSQNKAEANFNIAMGFNKWYEGNYSEWYVTNIKNFKQVIYYLTKAIELEPKANYYIYRAEAKEELKEYRGAIEDYTKAIELVPKAASGYSYRADLKEKLEDYRGAIEDYTKAIELDLKPSGYYYSLRASVKMDLEDYRGAILDYNKAIELEPESYYYNYRGSCKFNINNYLGAIADYTKAIQLDPKDANSYLNRGRLKILTKDKKGGCKDLSKAGELGEDEAYKDINESCN
jgi:tetratricopeptide (TPR) repeat protein